MFDFSSFKLGKQDVRHDPRTLQLANYLIAADTIKPPPVVNKYQSAVKNWGMMKNDVLGDCVIAAAGHTVMEWCDNAGKPTVITDDQVIKAYADITGYDPATGANDNGTVILDMLNYWRKVGIGGHKIVAYAKLEPKNRQHVRDAIYLFESCIIGLQLPNTAQNQKLWSIVSLHGQGAPGSWGGHGVPTVGYDDRYITLVTWGGLLKMTWNFFEEYCDEAYTCFSQDIFNGSGKCPAGFDTAQLLTDLKKVAA
jgi:hypothetical protein